MILPYLLEKSRSSEQKSDRATEQRSDRATERPSDRATARPSDQATEQKSDRATEQKSDRATDQKSGWNIIFVRRFHQQSQHSAWEALLGSTGPVMNKLFLRKYFLLGFTSLGTHEGKLREPGLRFEMETLKKAPVRGDTGYVY